MNKTLIHSLKKIPALAVTGLLAMIAAPAFAQTNHEVVEQSYDESGAPQAEVYELMTTAELEDLAGPIALYPDDLVSLVLPASTYPVQIVQAARYLEDRERDSSLQPPDDWDDAVVALLNYPEVIEMMNDDLDWTWALGEAFLNQQAALMDAIASFRGQAYAAGNLKSDERQVVTVDHEVIEIAPADPEVIYVPYYEPARVIVYQPYPVYYYHRYPRYSYYYPYPADYSFAYGYFFGVSTAYRLHWHSHRLYTYHYGYRGHPYYGRSYHRRHYFRHRPHHPYRPRQAFSYGRYAGDAHRGDIWKPRRRHGSRPRDGIRTPRAGARFTHSQRAGVVRDARSPSQRYRQRTSKRRDQGYVSPYTATKAETRLRQRARAENVHPDKAPRTRQLRQRSQRDRNEQLRSGQGTRVVNAQSRQRIRAIASERNDLKTRPDTNRIRSSRPAAPANRSNRVAEPGLARVRSSRASAQNRRSASPPLAYRQPQRQAPVRTTANRSRNVVVNRQPVRAAPQRQAVRPPQHSRPAQAAPKRQVSRAEERPVRAASRSERPRSKSRRTQRRR